MKSILTVLLVSISALSHAQVVKTFTGLVDGGNGTYQYYEDEDYKRVYHGRYVCNSEKAGRFIEGNFVNDKRDGVWHFRYEGGSPYHSITDVYKTYSNGKLNGSCSYKKVDKATKKPIISCSAQFNKNLQIGKFTLNTYNDRIYGTTSISYALNEEGLFEGPVHMVYKPSNINEVYEDKIIYDNGMLLSRLYRNTTTGQVYINAKRDSMVKYIREYFYAGRDTCRVPFVQYKAPTGDIKAYWPFAFVAATDDVGYRTEYNLNLGKFLYCGDKMPTGESVFTDVEFFNIQFAPTFTLDPSYPGSAKDWVSYWHEECESDYDSFSPKPSYCRGVEKSPFLPEIIIYTKHKPGLD